ncbi:hypothetical protein [Escherichia coli]|uniref:hypothetical protein n=1 Tax=Escherichia coli TaxID=562 RepID=UPI001CDC6D47|nr:hypothetical protein [Escherichia coli]
MNEVLGDLQRRLANMVRRGVIHSVRLDGGFPECRVDLGDIVTTWLPLCQGFAGKTGQILSRLLWAMRSRYCQRPGS